MMLSDRNGATLLEALVASLLAAVLLVGVGVLLAGLGRVNALRDATSAAAETSRLTRHVIGSELRYLLPADATAAADSLVLRALRGVGVVCASDASGTYMTYRGHRQPVPAKDSLLVLSAGGERSIALLAAAPAPAVCGEVDAGSRTVRLSAAQQLPVGAVLLVYERGHYFLSDHALRFRAGAAGRQPLTRENVRSGAGFARRTMAAGAPLARVDIMLPLGQSSRARPTEFADSTGFTAVLLGVDTL